MLKNFCWLPLILISIAFWGCSDQLSEAQAEKIIKDKVTFPVINSVDIDCGLIAFDRDSLPHYYYMLQEAGMFKVEYLGKGGFLVINHRFRVTPTVEAKKFIVKEDQAPQKQGETGEFMYRNSFKTGETYFEKINAIHEIPSLNAADVQYMVKVKNFTPFWNYYQGRSKAPPDTVSKRTFGMIKTNDGWAAAR